PAPGPAPSPATGPAPAPSPPAPTPGFPGAIPDANLSIETHPTLPGWRRIVVTFPASITPTATHPILILLSVRLCRISVGGRGGGGNLWLCMGIVRDFFSNTELIVWSIHETGHNLGLLNMPPAGSHDHDTWEEPDAAHKHHCRENDCVMYYQ